MSTSSVTNDHPNLYIRTHKHEYNYVLKWMIENIKNFPAGEFSRSPEFTVDPHGIWYAKFMVTPKGNYCLFLHREGNSTVNVKYNILISDSHGKLLYEISNSKKFVSGTKEVDVLPAFEDEEFKGKVFHHSSLLLTISITVEDPCVTSTHSSRSFADDMQQMQQLKLLSMDFAEIFASELGADLTLIVQGVEMAAHKTILCARSPVFAAMFQQNMVENKEKIIRIEDVNPSAMKSLLKFLYTGVLEKYDIDMALKVYYAADKYNVVHLREHCGDILTSKLPADTLLKAAVSILADRHNDESLQEKLKKFTIN